MAMRAALIRLRTPMLEFALSEGLAMPSCISSQALSGGMKSACVPEFNTMLRGFHTGSVLFKDIEVEIQQMGESITEGTIAEILKKEGDSVNEDETIAQIETDKVTIDVKAPSSGTLKSIKVSVDDTVTVGQVVAVIGEGQAADSGSSQSSSDDTKQEEPAKTEPSKESKKDSQSSEESNAQNSKPEGEFDHHERSHQPMLKFPQRMTADGQRISELSAEEQKQYTSHGSEKPESSSKKDETISKPTTEKPKPKPDAQERTPYMPWYVGREQGTKLSQSSVLSDFEMEQIELGGADP